MDSGGAKAQGSEKDASHAHPFRPRIDKKTRSKLSSREIDELSREDGTVDLDLLTPESSVWLRNILKLIRSDDFKKRFFALRGFAEVLLATVIKSAPELCASFAAYVIEQGILDELIRILRAAHVHGDFYLIGTEEADENLGEVLRKGLVVQCKVEVCFLILFGLMADARIVRFIRRSIPDLIDILEGAYLSLDLDMDVPGSRELTIRPPLAIRDDEKEAALMVLGPLSLWSDHARETILSRKLLLREILKECMAGTDFSGRIIDRVFTLLTSLIDSHETFLNLSVDYVEVAFKALEISNNGEVLDAAVSVLDWIVFREVKNEPLQMTIKMRSAEYLDAVLALAACPNLNQDLRRSAYNLFRISVDKIYSTRVDSANPEEKLSKLLQALSSKALSRNQQLCEIFSKPTVNQSDLQPGSNLLKKTGFLTKHDLNQKTEGIDFLLSKEDRARMKPCRKCSRSGCANTETDPGQFKLCSGCRLAVYCSRDCQKLAWRESHKSSCGRGGGAKQNRGKTDGF